MKADNKTTAISVFNPGLDDYAPPSPCFRLLNLPRQTYKIVPDYDISNSDNISIVNTLSYMYKPPGERIDYKKLSYYLSRQYWFDIIFEDGKANFYATAPEDFAPLVESKMKTVWNKANIKRTYDNEINDFNIKHTEVCSLVLKDYSIKSLSTDKSNLYPLTNMFGITKMLNKGEKVRVNIVIEPISRINWVNLAKDEHKLYKQGLIRNNELSTQEKIAQLGFKSIEFLLSLYIEYKMLILESFFGIFFRDHKEENKVDIKIDSIEAIKTLLQVDKLSANSNYKLAAETFKVKINILSQSSDPNRAKLNMLAVANSYRDLNEDNELTVKLLSKKEQMNLLESIMRGYVLTSKRCILSDKEVSKLIQLPQKTLQQEYKIESIDTREVDIPRELQGGKIRIGIAQKQGKEVMTTWSQDKNIMALAKVFVGPQNAGKTTAVMRTIKDCYIANYSNVVIDYIENCDTAKEIAATLPEKDKIMIKLGYENYIPSMAFNEVSALITENMSKWERVRLANLIAEQIEYLINAVTDVATGELTAPMLRYLHSACMVTFIKPGAKIEDVFVILRKWDKRNEAIRYAKYSECFSKDDDIFFDLDELHKRDKEGKIIGTREDLIVGVTNRITILKKNPFLAAMLKAEIDNNENFTNYIEQGKQIFIMIPQTRFPSSMVRDILTTYYISRIWLAAQMRENNKDARLCNIVFDEVHQVPTTAKFLSNHITELRRHRLGLILSCHFLKQLKSLLTGLKSSGSSYVLIAGTERENLETLKEEIKPFAIDEGMNLKPFTSMNIVNYGNQYAKFITRLPKS